MINKEKRYIVGNEAVSTRALKDDAGNMIIEGYGSVFNSRSRLLFENNKVFFEVMEREAFNDILQSENIDVLLTYQHNGNEVLARFNPSKGVNTLELSTDDKGLKFRAVLANTTASRDTWENIRSGNLYECSFVFTVDEAGERWEKDNDGNNIRYISTVSGLYDVSVVVNGAYEFTDVAVAQRSFEENVEDDEDDTPVSGNTETKAEDEGDVVTGLEDEDSTDDTPVSGDTSTNKEYNERDLDKLKIELLKLKY